MTVLIREERSREIKKEGNTPKLPLEDLVAWSGFCHSKKSLTKEVTKFLASKILRIPTRHFLAETFRAN